MKHLVVFGSVVFGLIGSYVPTLFGDTDLLSGWSILGGFIGGLFGIWAAVKLYNAVQ